MNGLNVLGEAYKPVKDFASAIDALRQGDFQARWDATKQLSSVESDALPLVLPLLSDSLHSPDPDVEQQWFIVKLLGAFRHPDAILALVTVLETVTNEEVCDQAAQSLAGMGPAALDCLLPLTTIATRLPMVVKALVQLPQPEVVPILVNAFVDSSAELRVSILNALSQFQHDSILAVVHQGLQDPNGTVCQAAIAGLAIQNNSLVEEKVQRIVPFLDDPRPEVADQAARSLGQLATDSATLVLAQKCCKPETSTKLQQTLIRALGWIGSPFALDGLFKVWDGVSQESPLPELLLQEILSSFAQMMIPEVKTKAAQKILEFLRSPSLESSATLKCSAILSLGRIADLSLLPDLINLLADPDYGVRLHVIAALKQVSADEAYQAIQTRSGLMDLAPDLAEGLAIALREW